MTTDEVRCPRGHLTSGKFPFCTECGAELNPQGADDDVVRCPNGHVVTGGHKFCIECGAPVEEAAPTPPAPAPTALTEPADDIAEVDEVRCPKGHLTPAEYPYCIICGAELEKAAAAPAKPSKRSVRRRPRGAPTEEPAPDAPPPPDAPYTEEIPPPPPPRRAPRPRRAARGTSDPVEQPVPLVAPVDEPAAHDEPTVTAPVASYASDNVDAADELFVHTPAAGRASDAGPGRRFDLQRWGIPVAAGLLAVIAAVILVLILRGGGTPTAQPTPLATANVTTTTAPTAAPTSAPSGADANVPMRVESSSVHPGANPGTYTASATIRNPTDFSARNVTVTFTLKDASGATLTQIVKTIGTLPSGAVTPLTAIGADPGGKQPASVAVQAVAAQIVS